MSLYPHRVYAQFTEAEAEILASIAGLPTPTEDSILYWSDADQSYQHLKIGDNLSITDHTISADLNIPLPTDANTFLVGTGTGTEVRELNGSDFGITSSGAWVPVWNGNDSHWHSYVAITAPDGVTIPIRTSDGRLKTATATENDDAATFSQLNTGLAAKINTAEKGAANGVATLDANTKIPQTQLPAIAITEVFVVNSEAEQLALTAQEGDVAIRTDEQKTYIHNGGSAGTMADWTELLFPPGGGVTSVATGTGLTGGPITTTGTIALNSASIASLAKADTAIQNLTDLGITVSANEINYLSGVTSSVQTQLNSKQATITGGATTILTADLTANRALVSNASGKVAVSAVTSTQLGYLSGVTSSVQTQLNAKANDNAVVKLSGNQTVNGVKTFGSIPVLPASNPTTANQAVRKGYVDSELDKLTISLDFVDESTVTIKAPHNMQIDTVTAEAGIPTITVNGSPYTLGNPIDQFDEIEIDAGDVDRLVNLNCTKL